MLEKLKLLFVETQNLRQLYIVDLYDFNLKKEITSLLLIEESNLKDEISNLVETCVELSNGKSISIRHTIQVTMIDCKVHTAISNVTSSNQCCCIGRCSPKDMNNIDKVIKLPYLSDELLNMDYLHFMHG